MKETDYHRLVQTSITAFIYKDDKYMFLKRNLNKRVDPGKLNGVGGRLEPGEDFLACCIREVEEETGYIVTSKDIKLAGVVKLIGGYTEDWVMCFFKVNVDSFNIPKGSTTDDGELIWLDKDKVLDSDFDVVPDLHYCFQDIVEEKRIFFLTALLNKDEVIESTSISYVDK
jgi:8-oxo-dGTP diphosphatase